MRKLGVLGAIATMLAVSGCASIVSGGQQKVSFKSDPSDARIAITDGSGNIVHNGVTPFEVKLTRGAGFFRPQHYTVKYEKPGYQPKEVPLTSGPNGWVFGNLVFGGLIGVVIDGASGAMFAFSPGTNSVSLETQSVVVSVQDVSKLSSEERARLTPIG